MDSKEFDFNDCTEIWNTSIKMKYPTFGELCERFDGRLTQVFSHSATLHLLRNNIVFCLTPGQEFSTSAHVQSIIFVAKERFFTGPTSVITHDVPRFSTLGTQLPDTPKSLLDHLQMKDKKHVKTATSINRWEIFYGDSISIMFNSDNPGETIIDKSSLAMIKYFFLIPYIGTLPISITPIS